MRRFSSLLPIYRSALSLTGLLIIVLLACNNPGKKGDTTNGDTTVRDTTAANVPKEGPRTRIDTSVVTVAVIRDLPNSDSAEVLFNESHAIYKIAKKDANLYDAFQRALRRDEPLKVVLDPRRGAIGRVDTPSVAELEIFRNLRKEIITSARPRAIDVHRIDTATFNRIEKLDFPVFRLCTNVVPDYATAKAIFDYCAQQSCHLPGPTTETPCIPFQYVRDGCYARAHKMRAIIKDKYGYCVEKVFSFANEGTDKLAVKANKWGGCCVEWWYHVAPLIRVKTKITLNYRTITLTLAYVIDPSMFDAPVLLSTWLAAQENTTCNANANVTRYSIQPGTAYGPTSYAGTSFSTDPTLSATHATCVNYRNLITCN